MQLIAKTASSMLLGYGAASINILIELDKLGIDISLYPIGNPYLTVPCHQELQKWINAQDSFRYDAPCLTIWHEGQLFQNKIGKGKHYGLSFFELDNLDEKRRYNLNSLDHIITASTWAKNVMLNNGITQPISVIPMGTNTNIFKPNNIQKPKDSPYVFFCLSKWEIRKSHELLPEIFNKAFTKKDNVEFWLMADNPFLTKEETQEWQNYYLSTPLGNKIKFINQVSTDQDLSNIINQVDCGISMSKSEGWNLSALYLLSCGKNLIITNYAGHTQFCTSENSHLIEIDKLENAYDGRWFGKGTNNIGQWAHIGQNQQDQTISYMRECYKERKAFNKHGVETASKLTWNNTATQLRDLIFGENND